MGISIGGGGDSASYGGDGYSGGGGGGGDDHGHEHDLYESSTGRGEGRVVVDLDEGRVYVNGREADGWHEYEDQDQGGAFGVDADAADVDAHEGGGREGRHA